MHFRKSIDNNLKKKYINVSNSAMYSTGITNESDTRTFYLNPSHTIPKCTKFAVSMIDYKCLSQRNILVGYKLLSIIN